HELQELRQRLRPADFPPKVEGMQTPPSPRELGCQGSVHPQEDGRPGEKGEEEDHLAAKNRLEDIQMPDGRKPRPINQQVTRQCQCDEAGHDGDNSDRDASSWHYSASLLCSSS